MVGSRDADEGSWLELIGAGGIDGQRRHSILDLCGQRSRARQDWAAERAHSLLFQGAMAVGFGH